MRVGDETLVHDLTPPTPPADVRPGARDVVTPGRVQRLRTWAGWPAVASYVLGFCVCLAADRLGVF